MELTIKNLKIAEFASEETLCFECSVYVDGKRAFTAKNDGQGGPNYYQRLTDGTGGREIDAAVAWAQAQELEFDFEHLDQIINNLVSEVDIEKRLKALTRKLLKKAAIYTVDGEILTFKQPYNPDNEKWLASFHKHVGEHYPKATE